MPGSIIVPKEALINWAEAQINDLPTMTDMFLKLFVEPFDVDLDTTLEDVDTIEASFPGYFAQQLVDWSDPVIVVDDASTEAGVVHFESPGFTDQQVYGLYATDGDISKLWWAATLVTPVPVPDGGNIDVVITLLLRSIFSS